MTNKESIQAAHLEAIGDISADTGNWGEYGGINTESKKDVATSCTTITAEAIGEFAEWQITMGWRWNDFANGWLRLDIHASITTAELVQLFLNQKSKI